MVVVELGYREQERLPIAGGNSVLLGRPCHRRKLPQHAKKNLNPISPKGQISKMGLTRTCMKNAGAQP